MSFRGTLIAFFLFTGLAAAQSPQTQQVQQSEARSSDKPGKNGDAILSKEEQKKAREALDQALGEARSLDSIGAAFAMAEVARGYARVDRAKAAQVLSEGFTATLALPPDDEFKATIQERILKQLLPLDRGKVEELLTQAEPRPKRAALVELVRLDTSAKRFDAAQETIERIATLDEFPYGVGTQLMLVLPPDQEMVRRRLFSEAMASYANHEHKGFTIGGDDFAGMIVRFWRHLPPDSVMTGIDSILKEAKEKDSASISLMNNDGKRATFTSFYDYRLFELLPVIKELDNSKAEKLLADNAAAKAMLQQYPQGLQSLDSSVRDTPPKQGEHGGMSVSISTGNKGSPAPPPQTEADAWMSRATEVVAGSAKDPEGALTTAKTLPIRAGRGWPRRMALEGIARQTVKKDPSVARAAAAALIEAAQSATSQASGDTPVSEFANQIIDAAQIYLRAEDPEDAGKALEKAGALANKSIDDDNNANDPNKAPKAYWPATHCWTEIVRLANKISADDAGKMLKQVSDDEIRALANVSVANALVGVRQTEFTTAVRKEKQHWTSISSSDGDDED